MEPAREKGGLATDPRIDAFPHTQKTHQKKRIVILFFYDSTNVVIDISLRLNTQSFYLRLIVCVQSYLRI